MKNSIWKIYSDELVNSEHFSIINSLNEIVIKTGEHLEGNICYHNNTRLSNTNQKFDTKMSYSREYFRRSISYGTNFCEIGFNAGHSSSLVLSENKKSKLLSLDIGHHKYTRPCMVFLKSYFKNVSKTWSKSFTNLSLATKLWRLCKYSEVSCSKSSSSNFSAASSSE